MVASFVGFTGFTLVMPFLALHFQALGETDVGTVASVDRRDAGVTPLVAALCAPLWAASATDSATRLDPAVVVSFVARDGLMAVATQSWQLFACARCRAWWLASVRWRSQWPRAPPRARRWPPRSAGCRRRSGVAPAFGPWSEGCCHRSSACATPSWCRPGVRAGLRPVPYLYREPPTPAVARKGTARWRFQTSCVENFLLLMIVIFGLQMVDRSLAPVMLLHLEALGYDTTAAPGWWACCSRGWRCRARPATSWPRRRWPAQPRGSSSPPPRWWRPRRWRGSQSTADQWALIVDASASSAPPRRRHDGGVYRGGDGDSVEAHGASFGFLTGAWLIGSAAGAMIAGLVAAQSMRVVFVAGVVVLAGLAFVVRRVMADPGGWSRSRRWTRGPCLNGLRATGQVTGPVASPARDRKPDADLLGSCRPLCFRSRQGRLVLSSWRRRLLRQRRARQLRHAQGRRLPAHPGRRGFYVKISPIPSA